MNSIENNLTLICMFIAMLFSAFLAGYFFSQSNIKQKRSWNFRKNKATPILKTDISNDLNRINRIETFSGMRGLSARDKIGQLSEEVKSKMASKAIDFTHIGFGNKNDRDDFTRISGIGLLIEEKLNTIGIYNYTQLCKMTDVDIRSITKVIEFFPGRIHRDDWKGQAKDLIMNNKKQSNS